MKKPMETPRVAKMMPTLSLDASDLPEINGWKVGGKYKLAVEVEQVSVSKDDMMVEGEKKQPLHARFRIIKVRSLSGTPALDKEVGEKEKHLRRMEEKANEY